MKRLLLFFTLVGAFSCFGMQQSAETIIQFEAADGSIISVSAADLAGSHLLADISTQTLTAPIKIPAAACGDDIRAALAVRRLDESVLPSHLQQLPHETCANLIETYAALFRPSAHEHSSFSAAAQIVDQKHATMIQYYLDRAPQALGTSAWDSGALKELEPKKRLNRILAYYARQYTHLPVLAKSTGCVVATTPRPFWLANGPLVACIPQKSNASPEVAIFYKLNGLPEKAQFPHQETLNAARLGLYGIVTSSKDTSPSATRFGLNLHDGTGKVIVEAVLRSQPTCLSSTVLSDQLAVGFRDGHVEIWDTRTFKEPTTTFTPHSKSVLSICWGPGEKSIITGSDDCTAASWSLKDQRLVVMRHTAPVFASAMNSNGNIITRTTDGTAAIWCPDGTSITTLTNKDGTQEKCNCMSLHCHHDHSLIATGSRDHSVKIWRFDGSLAYTLGGRDGHADAITALAWNSDGSILASGSYDGVIKFWDVCSQTCLATDHTHDSAIYGLNWQSGWASNTDSYIISLDVAGNIRFGWTRIASGTTSKVEEHFSPGAPAENLLLIKLFQNAQQQKKLSQEEYEKIIKLYPHMSEQTRFIAAQIAPEFEWPATETGTSPAQWLAQKVAYLFGSRKEKPE